MTAHTDDDLTRDMVGDVRPLDLTALARGDAVTAPSENLSLGDLEAALRDAIATKVLADRKESVARNEATTALNNVNNIQKRIDAKIAAMRAESEMRGTDWARREMKSVSL